MINQHIYFVIRKEIVLEFFAMTRAGFILAQKTLLDTKKMKFKWPRNSKELKRINKQQLNWLLSGLSIEQKTSFKEIDLSLENVAS